MIRFQELLRVSDEGQPTQGARVLSVPVWPSFAGWGQGAGDCRQVAAAHRWPRQSSPLSAGPRRAASGPNALWRSVFLEARAETQSPLSAASSPGLGTASLRPVAFHLVWYALFHHFYKVLVTVRGAPRGPGIMDAMQPALPRAGPPDQAFNQSWPQIQLQALTISWSSFVTTKFLPVVIPQH